MCKIFNSYAMGTSGLPDIYTQSMRTTGLRVKGVYIRQTTSAHGITNMQHLRVLIMHGQALSSSSLMYTGISTFIL